MAVSSHESGKPPSVASPPAYDGTQHPGPLPPGKYWLGQPDEKHHPKAAEAPSASALSVTARRPLHGNATASLHIAAIGDGPWSHQIWTVECTRSAYTFRNEATNSCLNYVDGAPVMEPYAPDSFSYITEWVLKKADTKEPELTAYYVSPRADRRVILGAVKGESFNKCSVQPLSEYLRHVWAYGQWRFESVAEDLL